MYSIIYFKKNHLCILVLLFTSCAYFNTFYNAKFYFKQAERGRIEKGGDSVPIKSIDNYGKVIKKCQKVIDDFPESKFIMEARLLMSISRYHRSEYKIAINDLNIIIKHGDENHIEQAEYWRALCKWKRGNVQIALDELSSLAELANSNDIRAKCFLSLADIALELQNQEEALINFQKAAKLTKIKFEKAIIYDQIARMGFDQGLYDIAKESYENVISNSLSKEKVENAHLQILKILRTQSNYSTAEKKIKEMLVDDKFSRIAGNLELELVQLYRSQGGRGDIVETRLESIVNDYQKTPVSAEAYYQLGNIYTSEKWDLEKANEYYSMVSKEYSRSLFSPLSRNQVKSITKYQNSLKELHKLTESKVNSADSSNSTTSDSLDLKISGEQNIQRSIPEIYYQLADLEAFDFKRYNVSIKYLNTIIKEYPESSFTPKAMFSLMYIYETIQDSSSASSIKDSILINFPNSEYAYYLKTGDAEFSHEQKKFFLEAELKGKSKLEDALELYRSVIKMDSLGSYSAPAAFTIAHHYDQAAVIDSAIKYYTFIKDKHSKTDQYAVASLRLIKLNLAISSMKNDSTISIDEYEN